MNMMELQVKKSNVESVKMRISNLFTQCLSDIEKTVSTSGLSMRDVGIEVEKYLSSGDSYIVEMKLQQLVNSKINF